MSKLANFSIALLLSISAFSKDSARPAGYDELHDSTGHLRPQYQQFYQWWSQLTENQRKNFLGRSRTAFGQDNALDPLPRIITGAEYDQVVKPGVEQRAKALRAFLQDHFSGQKNYAKAGIIPQDVLERIIKRSLDAGYEGKTTPEQVAFLYGPDIIRDEKGTFRVIEDNPGFIGGVGDLRLAYEYLLKYYRKDPKKAEFRSPEAFYRDLTDGYKKLAAKFGGKAVVHMTVPATDAEDARIRKIFADYGIETVTNRTQRQIKVRNDGVYIQNTSTGSFDSEKVGFVVMIGEHRWIDPSHRESKIKQAALEIESLLEDGDLRADEQAKLKAMQSKLYSEPEKVRIVDVYNLIDQVDPQSSFRRQTKANENSHGLVKAIIENKVGSNYGAGLDFIGDKEFYTFVEDMIRFYLHEEPILRNITTERFADPKSGQLNDVLFSRVFQDLSKWVIKKVDGRGGDAVWVGPKIKPEEIAGIQERIKADPGVYIVQAFTPLSYMNENIVDMRVITDVSADRILVTETPWGRGLPMSGNGKVNLSDKGREVTILIGAERAPFCKWIYK